MNKNIIIEWQLLFVKNGIIAENAKTTKRDDEYNIPVDQLGDISKVRDELAALREVTSGLATNKDISVMLKKNVRRQNIWIIFILLFFIALFWGAMQFIFS